MSTAIEVADKWYRAEIISGFTCDGNDEDVIHMWGRHTNNLGRRVGSIVYANDMQYVDSKGQKWWFVAFNSRDIVRMTEEKLKKCLRSIRIGGRPTLDVTGQGKAAVDNYHWEMSR